MALTIAEKFLQRAKGRKIRFPVWNENWWFIPSECHSFDNSVIIGTGEMGEGNPLNQVILDEDHDPFSDVIFLDGDEQEVALGKWSVNLCECGSKYGSGGHSDWCPEFTSL